MELYIILRIIACIVLVVLIGKLLHGFFKSRQR